MTTKNDTRQNLSDWYQRAHPTYNALTDYVTRTLKEAFGAKGPPVVLIEGRTKSVSSFLEKALERKRYRDPTTETTDITGVRVVTLLESDTDRAETLIRSTFAIDNLMSGDKSAQLRHNEVGYRSRHLVGSVGAERSALMEARQFRGLIFEIQVRSVLQHAWAQIEHSRGYKFAAKLPAQLQRRLALVSGTLELADLEFNRLALDIDAAARRASEQADADELEAELDSLNATELLKRRIPRLAGAFVSSPLDGNDIEELRSFGTRTVADLDAILVEQVIRQSTGSNQIAVVRDAMMFADLRGYFERAWNDRWQVMDLDLVELLETRYEGQHIGEVMREFGLSLAPDPDVYSDLPNPT